MNLERITSFLRTKCLTHTNKTRTHRHATRTSRLIVGVCEKMN